jgi:leucyl aminopeptidase (aminopeptidase T)
MVCPLQSRLGLAILSGLLLSSSAALASPPADTDALAQRLVAAAAVKEGEVVAISGQAHSAQLVEDIAVAARRLGAFPLVFYNSDRLGKRLFFDVPAKYDTQPDALDLKLVELIDVRIAINDGLNENLFEGADPKRLAARGKNAEPVTQAAIKRNVRSVEVGNGFYPTPWRAQRYGMSEQALADVFWQGIAVDPAAIQAQAARVSAALSAGGTLHITHPNGTDLTVKLEARPATTSDGVISAEDIQKGGAAVAVYLPAGEVYTTPVPGTANGKVVHSHDFFRGKALDDVTVEFKDGFAVSLSGSGPGYADFRAAYDAVEDPRKNAFGFVDIGVNPNVKLPAGSQVGAWVPAGTITVGSGSNTWAGGDNSVSYGWTAYLPGSTVTLDGKTIIEAGTLKL